MIRKAKIKDVREIGNLVNQSAAKGQMLPIALNQIYEQLRDFVVEDRKGKIVGCGALHIAWDNLAEIRSLAVASTRRHRGIGTKIVEALLEMAKEIGALKVFMLTYQAPFFEKFGFKVVEKEALPHKIWSVCLNCPKFPNCDETAMLLEL